MEASIKANNTETKYWVALSTSPKLGARSLYKLYKRFGKLEKVWQTDRVNPSSWMS